MRSPADQPDPGPDRDTWQRQAAALVAYRGTNGHTDIAGEPLTKAPHRRADQQSAALSCSDWTDAVELATWERISGRRRRNCLVLVASE